MRSLILVLPVNRAPTLKMHLLLATVFAAEAGARNVEGHVAVLVVRCDGSLVWEQFSTGPTGIAPISGRSLPARYNSPA